MEAKFCATANRVKNDSRCDSKLALHLIPQIFRPLHIHDDRRRVALLESESVLASHTLDRFYFGYLSSVTSVCESNSQDARSLIRDILRAVRRSGAPPESRGYRSGDRSRRLIKSRWSIFACNAMPNERRNSNFNESDECLPAFLRHDAPS